MSVALFSHPDCLAHAPPEGHPERPARLEAIARALAAPEFVGLDRRAAPLVDEAALLRAHDAAHLAALARAIPAQGTVALDADTHVGPRSLDAARRAAGAAVAAVDAVLGDEVRRAFCAVRPPGHHAERDRPMGFCLYSNAAIAALHALDHHGVARVAVIDFDVHHGNGTQDVLWHDPRALFVSSHQMPLWPGSGAPTERGAHGQVLNVPLAPGSDGVAMRKAYESQVFPRIAAHRPELLIISAGFDAHRDDPLAALEWEVGDFRWLTDRLLDLAEECCAGRVVSTLEGGYDLGALAAGVATHVAALMRD
jgi:acetoin utilization deacetylase AcuC-like enzyme